MRVGLYIVRAPASASRLQLTDDGLLKYLAKGSLPNDRCDSLFEPAGQIFDYLEWIVKYAFGRETIRDCRIDECELPKGTTVFMSQWLMHRDARYFDAPDEFRPDRWADGLAKRLPRFAYFPFGGGPRVCVGNSFVMIEAILLLATIAEKFRLELVPGHPVEPFPAITLRPRFGMNMTLRMQG